MKPPRPKAPQRPDVYTQGPYWLYYSNHDRDDTHRETFDHLPDAVFEFVRLCVPPNLDHDLSAFVMDHQGIICLGFAGYPLTGQMRWVGVKDAFEVFRRHEHVEPLLAWDVGRQLGVAE